MDSTAIPATFFASSRPAALNLPHLITALDAELIGKVAHLTKSKPGLWPVPAPFDEQDVYDRARESAPFAAWSLPANQAEVLAFGPIIQEAIFGTKLMFLDAAFPEEALVQLAVLRGERLATGAYVTWGFQELPQLPELVERCGWALIPIGPERSQGLFVVSPSKADWLAKLQEWCEREGRNFSQLRVEEGKLKLIEQPAPARYRDNAIAHHIDAFLGGLEVFFGGVDESILPAIEQRIQARRKLRQDLARSKQDSSAPCCFADARID
jgi:hypothetical protein